MKKTKPNPLKMLLVGSALVLSALTVPGTAGAQQVVRIPPSQLARLGIGEQAHQLPPVVDATPLLAEAYTRLAPRALAGEAASALRTRTTDAYSVGDRRDFWAVDFDWHPDKPFNHHWQDYRTRKDRSLKTVSDAEFSYEKPGTFTACVKVVDVFGCDTSITVEVEI